MDLSKAPNDKKLVVCKWYFRVGCFFLPFVWLVNTVWFFKEAFLRPPYDEQKQIKKYVVMSGVGALVWTVAIVSWVTVYQMKRASWGEFGEAISYLVPLGKL